MVVAGHSGDNSPPALVAEPVTKKKVGKAWPGRPSDLTHGLTLQTSWADSVACFGVVDRSIEKQVSPHPESPSSRTRFITCTPTEGIKGFRLPISSIRPLTASDLFSSGGAGFFANTYTASSCGFP
jgi:hypothetical protein